MDWGVGEAKQQLSRVLKAARDEPQLIRTRGTLVGAVLGPEDAAAFVAWKNKGRSPSLADLFADARRVCADEGIELVAPARVDRANELAPARAASKRKKTARARRHERPV